MCQVLCYIERFMVSIKGREGGREVKGRVKKKNTNKKEGKGRIFKEF